MKRNRLVRACVWCMLVLASFPLSAATDPVLDRSGDYGKFIVYFLHLGRTSSTKKSNHGDCELLISPDGKVMMVDCGAPVQGRYVVETLEALGIDHIDYFVNSHRHHDHLGGFSQVADHAKIDRVFVGPMEGYTGKYSMQMDQRCEADGIVQTKIGDGDSFMFGRDIEVSVYHPSKTAVDSTYTTEELNNSSLALKFSYGNTTVLLCGDLYMEGEQELLDAHSDEIRDIDVAKANHHGLWTSNQSLWIETINPTYCVAVSDILSDLGVMNRYKQQGTIFRQTVFNGIVKFSMDANDGITMLCQHAFSLDN